MSIMERFKSDITRNPITSLISIGSIVVVGFAYFSKFHPLPDKVDAISIKQIEQDKKISIEHEANLEDKQNYKQLSEKLIENSIGQKDLVIKVDDLKIQNAENKTYLKIIVEKLDKIEKK
jgi:hydroxymethylglutaryl-CoA reductase